jgi:FKBP-type peptidyl-prolyl cis-trans isomerase (trigger factor)
MPGPLRILVPLLLALAALGLGACGGNDDRDAKNAYVAEVNAVQNEFADTVRTVSERITPKSSSKQDRKTLDQFQKAIADAVKNLKGIDVPDNVQSEHDQLVAAMSNFGRQIQAATAALQNPDSAKIAEAQRTIQTATQTVNVRIDAAIAAINSKLSK